ncbi:MAG TPA: type II secretion system protein GspD, partial [Aquabacterium sp.]|nr:type II secretion system protein GspD [Aquabacterium sp.]
SSSGSVNPFTTVERKDVGLTLRVRPQVGEGGTVRMTVYQENSSVDPTSKSSSAGLTTNKSSIETTVVVDDGQTLVLGGLLSDSYSDGNAQVPLLGDIPVIGNLFKSRSRERNKKNLMVFLRPVVMRSQEDSNSMTLDRYDYMRQKQVDSTPEKSYVLPINEVPMLDPLKVEAARPAPNVSQPLDGANPPSTVVMPKDSGYGSKLVPEPANAGSAP